MCRYVVFLLAITMMVLIGCGGEPEVISITEEVEVTRLVEVEVPVEVTRLVEVEVTRIVEGASPINEEPDPVVEQDRNKILIVYADAQPNAEFIKAEGIAFANGYDVVMSSFPLWELISDPDTDIAGVLMGGDGSYIQDNASVLAEFKNNGGRLFLMYDATWAGRNDHYLREFLGISIAKEAVSESRRELNWDASMLPDWLKKFQIGVELLGRNRCDFNIGSYIISSLEGDIEYLVSDESGKERPVYFALPDKSATYFPQIFGCAGREYFFADDNIDLHDNEEAFLELLRYLSEP